MTGIEYLQYFLHNQIALFAVYYYTPHYNTIIIYNIFAAADAAADAAIFILIFFEVNIHHKSYY